MTGMDGETAGDAVARKDTMEAMVREGLGGGQPLQSVVQGTIRHKCGPANDY
jgi:hypothetical protein